MSIPTQSTTSAIQRERSSGAVAPWAFAIDARVSVMLRGCQPSPHPSGGAYIRSGVGLSEPRARCMREGARDPLRPIAERLITEIAAGRSSGRLLRRRNSEH